MKSLAIQYSQPADPLADPFKVLTHVMTAVDKSEHERRIQIIRDENGNHLLSIYSKHLDREPQEKLDQVAFSPAAFAMLVATLNEFIQNPDDYVFKAGEDDF